MPGACVLHASVSVFFCHVQPLQGSHVTKHESSPLHRVTYQYLPEFTIEQVMINALAKVGRGAEAVALLDASHLRHKEI